MLLSNFLFQNSTNSWVRSPRRFLSVPGFRNRQRINSQDTANRSFSPLKSTLALTQRRKSSDTGSETSVKSKVKYFLYYEYENVELYFVKTRYEFDNIIDFCPIGFHQHEGL